MIGCCPLRGRLKKARAGGPGKIQVVIGTHLTRRAPCPTLPKCPMERKPYPRDLTDRQWQRLAPLWPAPKPRGRPIQVPRREIRNAIRYVLRTGCAWRSLPHDFPDWRLVYDDCWTWRRTGLWYRIHEALRPQVRTADGRHPTPRAGILGITTRMIGRQVPPDPACRDPGQPVREDDRTVGTAGLRRRQTGQGPQEA